MPQSIYGTVIKRIPRGYPQRDLAQVVLRLEEIMEPGLSSYARTEIIAVDAEQGVTMR
jgi:hypothetical protein